MPFSASGDYTDDIFILTYQLNGCSVSNLMADFCRDISDFQERKQKKPLISFIPWSLCFCCTKFRKLTLWRRGWGKQSKKPHDLSCHSNLSEPSRNCAKELQGTAKKQQHTCAEHSGNEQNPGLAFYSQFLTFSSIDYAPYTFPGIYHSFYLLSCSYSFASAAFLEIYSVVYSVLPGDRRETEATTTWRLSDSFLYGICKITGLGSKDTFVGLSFY